MKHQQKISRLIGSALIGAGLLFGTVIGPSVSHAQQPNQAIGQYLEVTPVKFDLSIPAGAQLQREVTITNKHVAPISLKISFNNILPEGLEGSVKYTTDKTPYDLASWATLGETQLTLAPRQSQKVTVTLKAPANASPGGYYGMLRFSPTNRTDLPPVAIQGQIATLFLVRVPGQAVEKASIAKFAINQSDGTSIGWFGLGNEFNFRAVIKNEGNVHFATEPRFTADGLFNEHALNKQMDARNVFPQSERQFETEWKNVHTGIYTVKIKANLPGQPQAEKQFKVLIVTPLVAVITFVILILLLLWGGGRIRRKRQAKRAAQKKG